MAQNDDRHEQVEYFMGSEMPENDDLHEKIEGEKFDFMGRLEPIRIFILKLAFSMTISGYVLCELLSTQLKKANNDLVKALMASLPLLIVHYLEDPIMCLGSAVTGFLYIRNHCSKFKCDYEQRDIKEYIVGPCIFVVVYRLIYFRIKSYNSAREDRSH